MLKPQVREFIDKWDIYRRDRADPTLKNRDEIFEIQNRQLCKQIAWAAEGSDYYRELFRLHGIAPDRIRTVDDLQQIPLTSKDDYMKQPDRFVLHPNVRSVYDNMWGVIHTTGTTSGKPTPFYDTGHDAFAIYMSLLRTAKIAGITPDDVAVNIMPVPPVSHNAFVAARDVSSVLNIPHIAAFVGTPHPEYPLHNSTDYAIDLIEKHRATVIWSIASYARRLIMRAEEQGRDLSSIRWIYAGGEPCPKGMRDDMRERLRSMGAKDVFINNGLGFTEMRGTTVECTELGGSHNPAPDMFYFEVVDENGKRLPDGTQGLLALTHLNRRGTVLLRYLTGDLATISHETCPHCGRNGQRLMLTEGSAYAIRTKDLIKFKGI